MNRTGVKPKKKNEIEVNDSLGLWSSYHAYIEWFINYKMIEGGGLVQVTEWCRVLH